MYVSKEMLLAELPPNRDDFIIIEPDQQVIRDIIPELLDAYPVFAKFYDRIGYFFEGATLRDTCDNLYDFCKQQLQYREEPEEWQTSALPTGILSRGYCDCKGYASFIAGCLGAIARATGQYIDWEFCFASYRLGQKTPYHVFVIVHTEGGPLWVDPTPGADTKQPEHWIMATPAEPTSLQMVAGVNANGELFYTVGVTTTGDPTTDASLQAIQAFINSLPEGDLKNALKKSTYGALPLIAKWISGYKYTGGDYALGEIFINRVMNTSTKSRWSTPDSIVPIAWMYFSTLFGIPIAVNTDFDAIEAGSLSAYLSARPEQTGYVTQAQVTRAKQLLDALGHTNQQTVPQWPPTSYGLMPYVGPIPDPRMPGVPYNGTLPNGQLIQDGYPVTAPTTGQGVQTPGTGSGVTTAGGFSMGTWLLIAAGVAAVWWLVENE
jgi:hypothetical protein